MNFNDFLQKISIPVSEYKETLNPKIWTVDQELKPEVLEKLLENASLFIDTLKLSEVVVSDIVLTGSNANYNWTEHSDLDVHILLHEQELKQCETCSSFNEIEDCIQAKKVLWNDHHDIEIYGIPLEIYATIKKEQLVEDAGTFSLVKKEWLSKPQRKQLSINSEQVLSKAKSICDTIDQLISSETNDLQDIQEVLDKVAQMRKAGLDSCGEFSTENLVFKVLRSSGYLDKIKLYYNKIQDQELSLN